MKKKSLKKKEIKKLIGKLAVKKCPKINHENYKSFRVQFNECQENKTVKLIACRLCSKKSFLCTKYNEMCSSQVCFEERTQLKE